MSEKKQYKVISPVEGKDNKTHWTRVGSAFTNKDNSINVYLDAFPKSFQLQIRELTDEDRQRMEAARSRIHSGTVPPMHSSASERTGSANDLPF